MSEQRSQDEQQVPPGIAWGDPIPEERAKELRERLWAWDPGTMASEERPGPFAGERLTGAEVFALAVAAWAGLNADAMGLASAEEALRSTQEQPQNAPPMSTLHLERADLRGAQLEDAVLRGAQMQGALLHRARLQGANLEGTQLERATLFQAQLERVVLRGAQLANADLTEAHLEEAQLFGAHLAEARLERAHLPRANLRRVQLTAANLAQAQLPGANLRKAQLERANLSRAQLAQADLAEAQMQWANLFEARLPKARLESAQLREAILSGAYLSEVNLYRAQLTGAKLSGSHLAGASLREAQLAGADLRLVTFDAKTALNDVTLGDKDGVAQFADVRWGGVNLSVVDWARVPMLGDEQAARRLIWKSARWEDNITPHPPIGTRAQRLTAYQEAVRANRQLAVQLQAQGLNEEASRYAYRAQVLQRTVLRIQRRAGSYLFSALLAGLAGYGYRLWRIFAIYALAVLLFAAAYLGAGVLAGHAALSVPSALNAAQISLNAIHGRVFFAQFGLDTAQSWLATGESIIGIVIEGVFVAMLIQRFFGR